MREKTKSDLDLVKAWIERRGALEEDERAREETHDIQDDDRERERQRQLVLAKRARREPGTGGSRKVIVEMFTLEYDAFFSLGAINPNPKVYIDAWDDRCVDFFSEGEHIGRLTVDQLRWTIEAFTESGLGIIRELLFDASEIEALKPVRL